MAQWPTQTSDSFFQKNKEVLLKVGEDEFTYEDLMSWRCRNFMAAKRLSTIFESLNPKSVKELANRMHAGDFFELDGVGEACAWVWMNTLHACKIDVDSWLDTNQKISTMRHNGKRRRGLMHNPDKVILVNQKTA